jgi:small-conductance mechanosensitive channel
VTFLQNIDWQNLLTRETIWSVAKVLIYAVVGMILLRVVVAIIRRILKRRTTAQVAMLVTKGINYVGIGIILTLVLVELGVNLAPILGAAGIVGLAIGIASQASLSNIISGLFLVSEKPFEIGDVISTGDTKGVVEAIDLLSVKIRTFDNLYVRVPNERLANAQLTNITRYPIRRLDLTVTVSYSEDLLRVQSVLRELAAAEPLCLNEPPPVVLFLEFGDIGAKILLGSWFQKSDFIELKNRISAAILARFRDEGIRVPVGPRSVTSDADAFPIRIVDPNSANQANPS